MSHVLHLGDCLGGMAGLADKSVDHVICDPPYEAEAHTLQWRVKRSLGVHDGGAYDNAGGQVVTLENIGFAAMEPEDRGTVALHCARIARRWVIVFCQVEAAHKWEGVLTAAGLERRRIGIWVKPDGMPQYTGDRPGMGYESLVFTHPPGRSRWHGGGKSGVYTFNKIGDADRGRTGHPTQKPLALMERLVLDFTDPGELVCDPFAGSGTTGVACKRLGRNFIGWEKDPKFHAAAVKRIEAAREQFQLPRLPKAKQTGMVLHAPNSAEAVDAQTILQGDEH